MKTAFDGARYAVGATDSMQGTGVWSFIKAERGNKAPTAKPASKSANKTSTKVRFPNGKGK